MIELIGSVLFLLLRAVIAWALWNAIAPTYLPEPWSHIPFLHAVGMLLIYGSVLRAKYTPTPNKKGASHEHE